MASDPGRAGRSAVRRAGRPEGREAGSSCPPGFTFQMLSDTERKLTQ